MNRFTTALALVLAALPMSAQKSNSAQIFPSTEIQQRLEQLAAPARDKGSSGATLGDFGSQA